MPDTPSNISVFMASARRTRNDQQAALLAFYEALKRAGERVELNWAETYWPCDIAVVYGCSKQGDGAPERRRNLYAAHRGPFVIVETPFLGRSVCLNGSGLWAFIRRLRNKRTVTDNFDYFRVGLNGAFYNTGDFCNAGSPPDRWERLRRELNLELRPYRNTGTHILVVGQIPGDASLQGCDIVEWMNATAKELKNHTDRPIILRPHPGTRPNDFARMAKALKGDPQIHIDLPPRGTIRDALTDCWACVTYSSSSSVDALLAGIPAFTLSPANIAWPVTDHDLGAIESPTLHSREQWLYDLCYAQWSTGEIASGVVWDRLKDKADWYLQQAMCAA